MGPVTSPRYSEANAKWLIIVSFNSVTCKALHFKASSNSAEEMITAGLHSLYCFSCPMMTFRMAVISPSVKNVLVIPVFNWIYESV